MMIEVALNELADRTSNPNIPYSVDECVRDAVACARAGAQIVHIHARDSKTGNQRWHDLGFYVEAFRRIRAECDVILYPTQPGADMDAFRTVLALADTPDPGLDFASVDVVPRQAQPIGMREDGTFIMPPDLVPVDPLEEVIRQLRCRGVAFHIGMRDIGNMRYLEKYRQIGILDREVVIKPFFDEGLNGPTPDARGILMYLDSLPEGMSYRWLVTLAGGRPGGSTLRRLTSLAAAMGGHVRTGLGDNPRLDDNGTYTNVDHVRIAAEIAQGAGRRLATMVEARAMLGITKRIGCPAASDGVSA